VRSSLTRLLSPVARAFFWMAASGAAICGLNAIMRIVATEIPPMQAQFLRSLFGFLVMSLVFLPAVLANGLAEMWPRSLPGQLWRGVVHTGALALFFLSLPHLSLSDATAFSFTTPIWVMIGAALLLGERVSMERWAAAAVGFVGALIVIGPHFQSGTGSLGWSLVMLASSPLFAASALITKALTRDERSAVIVVWQALTVTIFSAPLAFAVWQRPDGRHLLMLAGCGVLGTIGHYCMTRAFKLANISAMQPVRFLDMVWAAMLGLLLFGEWPTASALAGGAIIVWATVWIARREARGTGARDPQAPV
jgi:drug/metabolite transporter (DMT)-like permease